MVIIRHRIYELEHLGTFGYGLTLGALLKTPLPVGDINLEFFSHPPPKFPAQLLLMILRYKYNMVFAVPSYMR